MFEVSVAQAGTVNVVTTENGGLSVDHWADRATETIISVGEKIIQRLSSKQRLTRTTFAM